MPACPVCGSDVPDDDSGLNAETFRGIIRRWERLRLFYVGWLGVVVLGCAVLLYPVSATLDFCVVVAIGAVIANLCFFTGPAIELYGTAFRVWDEGWTIALFLAGTALATLLALGTMVSFFFAGFAMSN